MTSLINVEFVKPVKFIKNRLLDQKKIEEQEGQLLGVFPIAVSVFINEIPSQKSSTLSHKSLNDTTSRLPVSIPFVDFALVIDISEHNTNSSTPWLGFYWRGSLTQFVTSLQLNNNNINININQQEIPISARFHDALMCSLNESKTCTLWIVENDSTEEKRSDYRTPSRYTSAYWSVRYCDVRSGRLCCDGLLPLRISTFFHTLNSFPIIEYHNAGDHVIFDVVTNLDRNRLFPKYPELDEIFTQALKQLADTFKQQKWTYLLVPKERRQRKLNHKLVMKTIIEQRKYLNLTLVNNLFVFRDGHHHEIDLLSICSDPRTGKSTVEQIVKFFVLNTFPRSGANINEFEKCKRKCTRLVEDVKSLRALFTVSSETESVLLYNAFLAKQFNNITSTHSQVTFVSSPLSSISGESRLISDSSSTIGNEKLSSSVLSLRPRAHSQPLPETFSDTESFYKLQPRINTQLLAKSIVDALKKWNLQNQ